MPTLELAPPAGVRAACARALVLAASLPVDQSLTADALSWARKLADGGLATPERLRAIKAWMSRHGMSARRAKDGRDAALYAAHGGDEGRKWAERVVRAMSIDPGAVHVPGPAGNEKDEAEMTDAAVTSKAMGHETLPIVDGEWDADAAVKRLRAWAGLDAEVASASARKKYSRGFAVLEGNGSKLSDYKFPFCDVRNGKLVAVAKGVSSAIGALNGERGGDGGLSESEKASALANLHKHQERWQEMQKKAAAARAKSMRTSAFELTSIKLAAKDLPEPGERDDEGYLCYSDVQVAMVGAYKGHPAGDFEFDSDVFEAMVASHEANPNGIVPFDFEHASESTNSSVMQDGAPAVGWILSLDNRGNDGLFAHVGWSDEKCVEYIKTGRYKFVSPAVVFNATDPVSGESVGPVLVSAAVTNRPFLSGMRPLSARADADAVAARAATTDPEDTMTREELIAALTSVRSDARPVQMTADEMTSRDKLIERLRGIFRLPELSSEADVLAVVDRFEELLAADPDKRDGIDVNETLESLRWCLGLPLLTSSTDVLAQIRKGLGPTDSAASAATTSARAAGGPTVTATQESHVMEKTEEHKALEAEHAKLSAAHAAFKGAACKALKMGDNHEAEDEIIEKIKGLVESLEKLQTASEARAKSEASADVEKVAARAKMTTEQKTALLSLRTSQPDAFATLYGALLEPVAPTAPSTPDPLSALALMNAVGLAGGAAPNAIPDLQNRTAAAAELSQKMHTATLKLMSDNTAFAGDYGTALKEIASRVAAGTAI